MFLILVSSLSKHTYIARVIFADGLAYGTLAGIIIGDLILGNKNPLTDTFQSNRFDPIASATFVMKENSNVLIQYLKDYPFLSSTKYNDIKMGQGKILDIDQEKCGVFRDENNQLHIVSAVCTHMKCIVNFNNAEKTWDCPCHGSRFTTQGKVIEGPAKTDLKKIDIKEI